MTACTCLFPTRFVHADRYGERAVAYSECADCGGETDPPRIVSLVPALIP